MPSQQQLRWSQLRVGITVVVSLIILGILVFLMNSTGGVFTKKITLREHFLMPRCASRRHWRRLPRR